MTRSYEPVSAPRGSAPSCKSWPAEAAMRLLMNCLDPEVADDPEHLRVHGGAGTPVRSWADFDAIVAALKNLAIDETLLVQSGRPVAVFRTHVLSPRVLIAHSNLVPAWSSADELARLSAANLTIDGQIQPGAWLYTGLQSGTATAFETLRQIAAQHFGDNLGGRLVVSGGLGNFGAALALATTMSNATFLGAEIDARRIERLKAAGAIDQVFDDVDAAIDAANAAKSGDVGQSVIFAGHTQTLFAHLKSRSILPDIATDLTGSHALAKNFVPASMTVADAAAKRATHAGEIETAARADIAEIVRALLDFRKQGAVSVDFGNNLRTQAELGGAENAFELPGFFPNYLRPVVEAGRAPVALIAMSGEAADIEAIDTALREACPDDAALHGWLDAAKTKPIHTGLPARVVWLKFGDHAKVASQMNRLVRDQDVEGPVVLARDDVDAGAMASPFRETEQLPDGSDPIADWPLLAAMLASACGATIVSVGQGGGVGPGYSVHASYAVVCNGSPEADVRLDRVFNADPALGLLRLAEAGSEAAATTAKTAGLNRPLAP